jgi:hypothetical protein
MIFATVTAFTSAYGLGRRRSGVVTSSYGAAGDAIQAPGGTVGLDPLSTARRGRHLNRQFRKRIGGTSW